jgi:hypothetical protein
MCLLSPRKVVEAFIRAAEIPAADWGPSRAVQLPGLTLSVAEMLGALERVAGPQVARRVRFERDARIEKIVDGWPVAFDSAKARRLGFSADSSMEEIIRGFVGDELGGKIV